MTFGDPRKVPDKVCDDETTMSFWGGGSSSSSSSSSSIPQSTPSSSSSTDAKNQLIQKIRLEGSIHSAQTLVEV